MTADQKHLPSGLDERGASPGWPDPLESPVAQAMRTRNLEGVDFTSIIDLFDQMERSIRLHRGTFCEVASLTHTPEAVFLAADPPHQPQMEGKAEAFDQIVSARNAFVDAVAVYNERLALVRAERERGNFAIRPDLEYEAMGVAQRAWHKTCQTLADAALATTEGQPDAS